jgi:hypothetical protein
MESIHSQPPTRGDNLSGITLLSTIIASSKDGDFSWSESYWLMYHEAFRREILRVERAFTEFDPLQDAWKAVAMYRWLTEFLLPMLRHYEVRKREYIKSFYKSKGYVLPRDINYSEFFLQDCHLMIAIYAQECLDLSLSDNLFPNKIKESVAILRTEVIKLKNAVFAHYDAEERFWPQIFEKEGLEAWNSVYSQMLSRDRKENPKLFKMMFAMIFHALGYNLHRLSAQDSLDALWCGPKTRYMYVKSAPFIVKSLPMVKWMQDYLKFKSMINSIVYNSDDDYGLECRYRAETLRRKRRAETKEAWSQWLMKLFGGHVDSRRSLSPSQSNFHNVLSGSDFSRMGEDLSCRSSDSNVDDTERVLFTPEYEKLLAAQKEQEDKTSFNTPQRESSNSSYTFRIDKTSLDLSLNTTHKNESATSVPIDGPRVSTKSDTTEIFKWTRWLSGLSFTNSTNLGKRMNHQAATENLNQKVDDHAAHLVKKASGSDEPNNSLRSFTNRKPRVAVAVSISDSTSTDPLNES